MLLWLIKVVLVSVLLIGLVHYAYDYMIRTFTRPKVRDMVQKPRDEYETIMKTIGKSHVQPKSDASSVSDDGDMRAQLRKHLESGAV